MIAKQYSSGHTSNGGDDVQYKVIPVSYSNFKFNSPTSLTSPKQNVNKPNSATGTPFVDMGKILLQAAKDGDNAKVQDCVSNGSPFITDWLGTSALHVAAKNNHYETCATLLRSGISKDAKTKVERTPLHFAVFEGNFDIVQLLLSSGCFVDPLDMLKMTPLHWAIEKGWNNIAETLIDNSADPHVISKFGKTPYSLAQEKNNAYIINMIETYPTRSQKQVDDATETLLVEVEQQKQKLKKFEDTIKTPTTPLKRESMFDFESDIKRSRMSSQEGALQLLKDHGIQMIQQVANDNMIESALASGRNIILSEAGKLLMNSENLNRFLKVPINTTISRKKSLQTDTGSPVRNSLLMESDSEVVEILSDDGQSGSVHKNKTKLKPVLKLLPSADFQELTITRSGNIPGSSKASLNNNSLSLTPIANPLNNKKVFVPKSKFNVLYDTATTKSQQITPTKSTTLPSRQRQSVSSLSQSDDNDTLPEQQQIAPEIEHLINRKFSELTNNYQLLQQEFEREQQKSELYRKKFSQLEASFILYRQQQQMKFNSLLKLVQLPNRVKEDEHDNVKEEFLDDSEIL